MSPVEFSISCHYEGYPDIAQGGYAAGLIANGPGPPVRLEARPAPGTELVMTAWPMRPARGRLLAESAVWNGKDLVAVTGSMWFERPA